MNDAKLVEEISLDKATSGMVLAKPILEKSGACLMPARAELTERSLHALKNWGVLRVTVVTSTDVDAVEPALGTITDQHKRIDALFRNSRQHDANRALMECLRRYRTREHHDPAVDR